MIEHFFQCPYCFETISILIDSSEREQSYIEDCEVCCNPISFQLTLDGEDLVVFSAENLGQ